MRSGMTSLGMAGDSGVLEPRNEEAGTKQMEELGLLQTLLSIWALSDVESKLCHK